MLTRFWLAWGLSQECLGLPWLARSGCQRQPQRLDSRHGETMHAHRSRSCDASCIDRLIVGAVVGSQNVPARVSQGASGKAPRVVKNRSRSYDASCVDRLIVGAVVGSQIEPARASQGAPGKAPRAVKIESKSVPNLLGTPYSTQKRPDAAPGSSRERLGASPARPSSTKRVLKAAPRH